MKVTTHTPLIQDPKSILKKIANFWDDLSLGWHTIWGPHIHHGYYGPEENLAKSLTPEEKLIEKIIQLIPIKPDQKVLDVGCGLGGTSLYLASQHQLEVTGITLSKKQLDIANSRVQEYQSQFNSKTTPVNAKNVETKVQFKLEDAHSLASFHDQQFDIVWSLESAEQFYDKNLFIAQAHRVLKPGGKLMIATWCSEHEFYEQEKAKIYNTLCHDFDVPYMPTLQHYVHLLENNHFKNIVTQDWSEYVKNSWDLGLQKLKNYSYFELFKLAGFKGLKFIKSIKLMSEAFKNGQVRYGILIANAVK